MEENNNGKFLNKKGDIKSNPSIKDKPKLLEKKLKEYDKRWLSLIWVNFKEKEDIADILQECRKSYIENIQIIEWLPPSKQRKYISDIAKSKIIDTIKKK